MTLVRIEVTPAGPWRYLVRLNMLNGGFSYGKVWTHRRALRRAQWCARVAEEAFGVSVPVLDIPSTTR